MAPATKILLIVGVVVIIVMVTIISVVLLSLSSRQPTVTPTPPATGLPGSSFGAPQANPFTAPGTGNPFTAPQFNNPSGSFPRATNAPTFENPFNTDNMLPGFNYQPPAGSVFQ